MSHPEVASAGAQSEPAGAGGYPSLPGPGESLGIGRDPSNPLVVHSLQVSRFHAKIVHKHKSFCLQDCDSANGTFVNGQKVQSYMLEAGDVIQIGPCRIRFDGKKLERFVESFEDPEAPQTGLAKHTHDAVRRYQAVTDAVATAITSTFVWRLLADVCHVVASDVTNVARWLWTALGRLLLVAIVVLLLAVVTVVLATHVSPPAPVAVPAAVSPTPSTKSSSSATASPVVMASPSATVAPAAVPASPAVDSTPSAGRK